MADKEEEQAKRVSVYCPRCRDYTRQIADPVHRSKRICTVCGLLFSLEDSDLALDGKLEVWDGRCI